MYNNLYKSSYVNQDQKVRVIESNEKKKKKLDNIDVQYRKTIAGIRQFAEEAA